MGLRIGRSVFNSQLVMFNFTGMRRLMYSTSISCGMQLGDVPPRDEQNATEVMRLLKELSKENSPSVHPAIAMIDGDPMSANHVLLLFIYYCRYVIVL